jgi:hypothetical protein
MSLVRPLRKSICGLVSYRGAVMCVAALSVLLARGVPPSLPHSYPGSIVHSLAEHGHRQCFDNEAFQWVTSPSRILTTPPPVASPHLIATAARVVDLMRDGWHFNRPPPVS